MANQPPRAESLALLQKLEAALKRRGIVTEEEIAQKQASADRANPMTGARMVARAWIDPEWRALLLRDGTAAAEAMGIPMRGNPPLGVLEDTAGVHHLVVCTLCSCYPRAIIGYPPHWYKSAAYRSRAVREPRAVLAEFGTIIPDNVEIRVSDSTAIVRYLVLPRRPEGTESWSEAALASCVTRDAMIGVVPAMLPEETLQ